MLINNDVSCREMKIIQKYSHIYSSKYHHRRWWLWVMVVMNQVDGWWVYDVLINWFYDVLNLLSYENGALPILDILMVLNGD